MSPAADIRPVGSRALIVDLPDLDSVMRWHAALARDPLEHQSDVVAAARTVLVTFDSAGAAARAVKRLRDFDPADPALRRDESRITDIAVRYDGADLAALADQLRMSPAELIEWHTSTQWVAAFGGFAPGFTYCVPAHGPGLAVPRRESPRTAVPAGAVALGGEFSAVYPRSSPGGWQLIGTTDARMWDSSDAPPALVSPGDRVRYRAIETLPDVTESRSAPKELPAHRPVLRVDDPGMLTLYQDLGRPGMGDFGVSPSGSADRASARTVNAAVGNARGAALLEVVGGCALTALTETVVAVTGARADVSVNGRKVPLAMPVLLRGGETLLVAPPYTGMRSYVAVRGGLVAETELGSAAHDQLSGLGPAPLGAGDTVATSLAPAMSTNALLSNPLRVKRVAGRTVATVRCVPGPREDWFDAETLQRFYATEYTVTSASNRVGLRLQGDAPLRRAREGELPSEGMVAGCVQVPPSGEPVLFMRDHAITGGYPVIATVISEDIDIAAQLPPGSVIRFESDNTQRKNLP